MYNEFKSCRNIIPCSLISRIPSIIIYSIADTNTGTQLSSLVLNTVERIRDCQRSRKPHKPFNGTILSKEYLTVKGNLNRRTILEQYSGEKLGVLLTCSQLFCMFILGITFMLASNQISTIYYRLSHANFTYTASGGY